MSKHIELIEENYELMVQNGTIYRVGKPERRLSPLARTLLFVLGIVVLIVCVALLTGCTGDGGSSTRSETATPTATPETLGWIVQPYSTRDPHICVHSIVCLP